MIKDILDSLQSNIKQKTTNPFLGTLILVWIIHNWKYVLTFFNFGSWTIEAKIAYLSQLFDGRAFLLNLLICIIYTILALVITYAMLNLSRLIVNIYEKQVTPFIYKITDKSSIVLKEDFDRLQNIRLALEKKLETERDERLKIQNDRDVLEKRLGELLNKEIEKPSNLDNLQNTNDSNKIDTILKKIESNQYLYTFDKLIIQISKLETIKTTAAVEFFLKLGLIEITEIIERGEQNRYRFTDLGNLVKNAYILRSA